MSGLTRASVGYARHQPRINDLPDYRNPPARVLDASPPEARWFDACIGEITFRPDSVVFDLQLKKLPALANFQYNGYWMRVVDPWPETWADGWYDNGYYLHNTRYPNVALSLQLSR